jgi:HD-like signal output (HDOD) protein
MGKIVFFKKDAAAYSRIFAAEKGPDDPDICAYEIQNYGEDHARLGAALIKQWNLPPELATAVLRHHEPDAGGLPLVAAVALADMLTKQAGIGNDGDRKTSADLPTLQQLLKMEAQEFDALSVMANGKRADVEEFFRPTL